MDYFVTSERVETAEALLAALDKIKFDVIISDHVLPSFCATDALAIIQKLELDIPFIIVSGIISENQAIALMQAGASDYIFKDRLARLGPVVKRELNFAQIRQERRESQRALEKSLEEAKQHNQEQEKIIQLSAQLRKAYDLAC